MHAATFCSFATVAALYFLDFDGSTRERLGGYAAATAVGLVGLVIGTFVAHTLWLAAIAALFVAFAFAFARVLRGYVARSAVGVQMAFVLAVLTLGIGYFLYDRTRRHAEPDFETGEGNMHDLHNTPTPKPKKRRTLQDIFGGGR